jgi:hypothetical protein
MNVGDKGLVRGVLDDMISRIAWVLLLLVSCSPISDVKITKTLSVSAERLAEIRGNPHPKRYLRESLPLARLVAQDKSPLLPGILLYGVVNDPYLDELGFAEDMMIAAINGRKVQDIFTSRWQKLRLRRPAGFHNTHYRDLIEYLFIENQWDQFVVTVYLNVPSDIKDWPAYVPKVEHWRIKLK